MINEVKRAIESIENSIDNGMSDNDLIKALRLSSYTDKYFDFLTGITIKQYIRNRRLYLAALEIRDTDEKITYIAKKYGFREKDTFNKAFNKFHGYAPSELRYNKNHIIRIFLKYEFELKVIGGTIEDPIIVNDHTFEITGYKKKVHVDNLKKGIIKAKDCILKGHRDFFDENDNNCHYSLVYDTDDKDMFSYVYGLNKLDVKTKNRARTYKFYSPQWAVFSSNISKQMDVFDTLNLILTNWFSNNKNYVIKNNYMIQIYKNTADTDLDKTELWIPVEINK